MSQKSEPVVPPAPPARVASPFVAGTLGGALGGIAAGAMGGAFGHSIAMMAPPTVGEACLGALIHAIAWGLAAAVVGGPLGWLARRWRDDRAAFSWPIGAAFWSALAAAIETDQAGWSSGILVLLIGMPCFFLLRVGLGWLWRRRRIVGVIALAWLVLCLVGEWYGATHPPTYTPLAPRPGEPVVQLRSAPLPEPLGTIAVHCWFLAFNPDEGTWHRWELWQTRDPGLFNWGHVTRDLSSLEVGVGGGPGRIEREWHGDEARRLIKTLERSGEYPDRDQYFAWPGPNSNTYIDWVLRESAVGFDLGPRGIGRDYRGRVGAGLTTTGTGVQAESTAIGVKVGLREGIELHLLGFTFGIGVWPPAIKTPLGRFGFPE
jgi:hypothetical protein